MKSYQKFIPRKILIFLYTTKQKILRTVYIYYYKLLGSKITLREGTTDKDVFKEIFINKEFKLPVVITQPKLIIDCGAYIGLSSLFFAYKYKTATIFAIEPEPGNYSMMKKFLKFSMM